MNSKLEIRIGVCLLTGALILLGGYFVRKHPPVSMDVGKYAYLAEETKVQRGAENKVNPNDLLAKNLFHPQRGVIVADEKNAEKTKPIAQSKEQFELTGIFRYQGVRGALIAGTTPNPDPKVPKPRRLYKQGDALGNGYHLIEISDMQVIVARGGEKITLPLKKKQEK